MPTNMYTLNKDSNFSDHLSEWHMRETRADLIAPFYKQKLNDLPSVIQSAEAELGLEPSPLDS